MFRKVRSQLVQGASALAILAIMTMPAQAEGDTVALFTGVDLKKNAIFGYGGALFALDGLGNNSLAFKGFVGGGGFEWDNNTFVFDGVDGSSFTFDALVGYRMFLGNLLFGVYGGVNYWDIDQDCRINPNNAGGCNNFPNLFGGRVVSVIGDEVGFKAEGELTYNQEFYLDARGSYSTAFDTYWSRARVGINLANFTIGPEGVLLGNDDYDQARIGGFAMVGFEGFNFNFSVGYSDVDGVGGSDSVYGTAGMSTTF